MMKEKFSKRDLEVLAERDISVAEVEDQVKRLLAGGRKVAAISACIQTDGISKLSDLELGKWQSKFQLILNSLSAASQFIPASGAASRMFKSLVTKMSQYEQTILKDRWKEFPFAEKLSELGLSLNSEIHEIVAAIVDGKAGLGLAEMPKGCVPFHAYPDQEVRTAFEEHVVEWGECCEGKGGLVFTIQNQFRAEIERLVERANVPVALEVQHHSTDTIAWNLETNSLLRDQQGGLVWRPGGHGALLKNLGEVDSDLVFVRNIDNVVDEWGMTLRRRWQQALGGLALGIRDARDEVVMGLRNGEDGAVAAARDFLRGFVKFGKEPETREGWLAAVNRPIRVAGMVPNVGQPGGGPFWIEDDAGNLRPGIAEKAELADGLMEAGTHFNPVELACVMVDADGNKFDLSDFADHSAYFTAEKTHGSVPIRILERPGLWNGGMAGWLTQFVEVPAEIFAPVKTVFDLLERRPRRRS